MRRAIIFLASLIFLGSCAAMQIPNQGPTAVLTFGIYRDFPEALSAVYEEKTLNLLKQSADAINREIFGWPAFEFKALFAEKWPNDEMPVYQDKEIIFAIDTDKLFVLMEKRRKPEADVYLFITNSAIASKETAEVRTYGGRADKIGGNKIAIGNFPRPGALPDIIFLLHEVGHILGIHHFYESLCEEVPFLMCLNWNEKVRESQIVFDEDFVKAILKFYRSRASQAPPQ